MVNFSSLLHDFDFVIVGFGLVALDDADSPFHGLGDLCDGKLVAVPDGELPEVVAPDIN